MRRPGSGLARRVGVRGIGGGSGEAAPVDDAPSAPTNLVVTPGDTQLALDWDDSPDGDFDHFVVEYKLASEPTTWTAHSTPTLSTATITGLTNFAAYDVRVRAVDAAAQESTNTTGSGTPVWDPSDSSAPRLWFEELYVAEGGSPTHLATWTNKIAGGAGGIGDGTALSTRDPDIIDPDTDYASGIGYQYTEANIDSVDVGTVSTVKFLHIDSCFGALFKVTDGGDVSQHMIASANATAAASANGVNVNTDTTAGEIDLIVHDGSGAALVNVTAPGLVDSQVHSLVCAIWASGSDTRYQLYLDGAIVLDGTVAGRLPSSGDAAGVLRFGAQSPTRANQWQGTVGVFAGTADHTDAADMAAWLETRRG